jgi:hypothetical protein
MSNKLKKVIICCYGNHASIIEPLLTETAEFFQVYYAYNSLSFCAEKETLLLYVWAGSCLTKRSSESEGIELAI